MFGWFKKRRRRKLRAAPLPDEWRDYLESHVKQYRLLSEPERDELEDDIKVLVPEKEWVGCNGLEMTDEIRVTIAGYVSLMLLGAKGRHHYFDGVLSVLVYPTSFKTSHGGETYGEAWQRGPVVLAWSNILDNKHTDQNVVIHEFAHQLDGLDGTMEGYPPLSPEALDRWEDIVGREYERLVRRADRGKPTLLDHYGAQNRAEFFAVLSECFFEQPIALAETHPELFALVADFYMQDPRSWYRDTPKRPVAWQVELEGDDDDHDDDDSGDEREYPLERWEPFG